MAPAREDWNRRASRETVLAAFGTWKFPWLNMPAAKRRCYYDKTMVQFLSMIRGNFTTETQRTPRSETEIGLKLVYLRLGARSYNLEEA